MTTPGQIWKSKVRAEDSPLEGIAKNTIVWSTPVTIDPNPAVNDWMKY